MGEKVEISLVVIGHVGSGKSTAIGNLARGLTVSTSGYMDRFRERVAQWRSLFTHASPLDELKAELERGIATSSLKFDTTKNNITVTDASGHRDFMKNMITGTSKADCAVLFIDCTPDGFEVGMSKDGQTRGHMVLAHTLGIKQLICCCNKMDATIPKYSEERYDEIVRSLSSYSKQIGFDPSKIHFIPTSGFGGDNLIGRSTYLDWYDGPTLHEALDQIVEPKTPSDKPLRLPVQDVYKIIGIGTVPVGRIETGILEPGMKITFGPTGVTAKVKSVEMHDEAVLEAFPGDNVGFHVKKVDAKDLKRGYVASNSIDDPAKEAASFTCLVTIMKHPGLLFNGCTLTLDCHTARVPAKIVEILSKIDRRSGMEIEREPEFLKNGDAAVMKMVPTKPIVVEAFSDYPPLGRFVARDRRQTVVVGVIKNVEKKEYPRGASNMKFDAKEAAKRSGAALRDMLPLLATGAQCFLGVGENEM